MTLSITDIQRIMDASPMVKFMNMVVDSVDAASGKATFTLPMRAEFNRAPGSGQFHGGAIAMFIDTAGDFAIAANVDGPVPTINLRVDYLRPARGALLRATAQVRKLGRTIGVVDIDVVDTDGRLVAIGRGAYSPHPG